MKGNRLPPKEGDTFVVLVRCMFLVVIRTLNSPPQLLRALFLEFDMLMQLISNPYGRLEAMAKCVPYVIRLLSLNLLMFMIDLEFLTNEEKL